MRWIVNRHEKSSEISLDDLQRKLGVGALITMPNQHDIVTASVNQGVPVDRLAPAADCARAARARRFGGAADAGTRSSRWLSGLWRGAAA